MLYEFFCIFEISDFYCNQFWKLAPGINDEITFFCEMKNKTIFSTFGKIDVNAENADPFIKYTQRSCKKEFSYSKEKVRMNEGILPVLVTKGQF